MVSLRTWLSYKKSSCKHRLLKTAVGLSLLTGLTVGYPFETHAIGNSTGKGDQKTYQESFRPQFHYSPAKNWMNDPNGLIYYKGEYHLFYQYNKYGSTGGNASWGHAVSKDLTHWKELPIAIPVDDHEEVWSGSVVFDKTNSSGLGTANNPPLIAVYTSAPKDSGLQQQSLAYSADGGTTWTKYAGNPVLDIGSRNFRDPKVFWYEPTKSWRMVVALSDQHKVAIYSSPNLKDWSLLSEFGPAGVTSSVWECPDLFPMALDGNKKDIKWVLTVNVAGKAEYFVGKFNGSKFTDEEPVYTPPTGTILNDFEGSDYSSWTTTGTAFGTGPVKDVSGPTGYLGHGFVDSYHGNDSEVGTLTSPAFTINQSYLNFLIGGGNHPYVEDASTTPPSGKVFEDFEGSDLSNWTGTGDFVDIGPTKEKLSGQLGDKVLDTFQTGDRAEGTVTSKPFTISSDYINFLIGGGNHPSSTGQPTVLGLVIDGNVVASATGNNSGSLDWTSFDVSKYRGKQATLQIVDQNDGSTGWGHFMVDHIVFSDVKAKPWAMETAVNLLVNGKMVRTATGNNSGTLDWTSWDLGDLQGKQAQIQIVDQGTGGWGHILTDQFTLADAPATNTLQRAHWIDHGQDFYAAVTYNDVPKDRRIMIGWMNNWNYANDIPTSPWRGVQSLPRELKLQTIDGKPQIVQSPVQQTANLTRETIYQLKNATLAEGNTNLGSKASSKAYRLDVTFKPNKAKSFGINVRTGNSEKTVIGYDVASEQLYLDRTQSGDVQFNSSFPSVERVAVPVRDGKVSLEIYVDHSSVEIFADGGRVAITDQIFPNTTSDGIQLFSTGGKAIVDNLKVSEIASIWSKQKNN
ncbi:GH32 C-terminal domain-containing protein [Terrilactibacillus laevilacticus]|uniref:GH32 C-terminal domain-containing protein n=1 Tax=Terrilactibacillus laevilacticus TaxID=1380157 RepID=A0ABW5PMK5_9BACI|nr:GH32 C-terminal domain-containing protein [Terrilactibacillus laevilacticus]